MNENTPQPQQVVVSQRPESGTVTALAVISIIFGTIALLGSFIPCLGALAIWIAIPAALCGAGATYLAKTKGCSIGLPVAAFIVSVLAIIISSVQIMALSSIGKAALDHAEELEKAARVTNSQLEEDQRERLSGESESLESVEPAEE